MAFQKYFNVFFLVFLFLSTTHATMENIVTKKNTIKLNTTETEENTRKKNMKNEKKLHFAILVKKIEKK